MKSKALMVFYNILNWLSAHAGIGKSGCASLKRQISLKAIPCPIQSLEIRYSPTLWTSNKSLISYPDASRPLLLYAAVMPRDNIACHFLWWEPLWGHSPVLCNKTQNDRSIKMDLNLGLDDFHYACLWNKAINNTNDNLLICTNDTCQSFQITQTRSNLLSSDCFMHRWHGGVFQDEGVLGGLWAALYLLCYTCSSPSGWRLVCSSSVHPTSFRVFWS